MDNQRPIRLWVLATRASTGNALIDALVGRAPRTFNSINDTLAAFRSGEPNPDVLISDAVDERLEKAAANIGRVWFDVQGPERDVHAAPDDCPHNLEERIVLAINLARMARLGSAFEAPARRQRDVARSAAPGTSAFEVHFQPQWTMDGARLTGAEGLLRWHGLDVASLSAEVFISDAEDSGAMSTVGDLILARACAEAEAWASFWPTGMALNLNLSPEQLTEPLISRTVGLCDTHRLPPANIQFEVNAVAIGQLTPGQLAVATALTREGFRLAVDQTGRTLVSADQLMRLPVDTLKLDRRLVQRVPQDNAASCLLEQLVRLAHGLGLKAVAVGVEHEATRNHLVSLGCDAFQGYLLAAPLPPAEFGELLKAHLERVCERVREPLREPLRA